MQSLCNPCPIRFLGDSFVEQKSPVIPAKAGIQQKNRVAQVSRLWIHSGLNVNLNPVDAVLGGRPMFPRGDRWTTASGRCPPARHPSTTLTAFFLLADRIDSAVLFRFLNRRCLFDVLLLELARDGYGQSLLELLSGLLLILNMERVRQGVLKIGQSHGAPPIRRFSLLK